VVAPLTLAPTAQPGVLPVHRAKTLSTSVGAAAGA
jgi:hypothetical protein